MSESTKQKIKDFFTNLSHRQVSVRKEDGTGIDIPGPVALLVAILFLTPTLVACILAMAFGYKFSVKECEDPCEKDSE